MTRLMQIAVGIAIVTFALGLAGQAHAGGPSGDTVLNYGHCVSSGGVEPTPPGGPEETPGHTRIGPAGMAKAEPIFGDIIKSSNGPTGTAFFGGVGCSKG